MRASRFVRKLGFELPAEPEYDIPSIPADITSISDTELMELFNEIISWIDYTEVYYVSAQIDEEQENLKLKKIEASEQIRHRGEKTVTAARAMTYENHEYTEQQKEVFLVFSRRKLLEVVYNSLDRKQFIVSREITRRKYGSQT